MAERMSWVGGLPFCILGSVKNPFPLLLADLDRVAVEPAQFHRLDLVVRDRPRREQPPTLIRTPVSSIETTSQGITSPVRRWSARFGDPFLGLGRGRAPSPPSKLLRAITALTEAAESAGGGSGRNHDRTGVRRRRFDQQPPDERIDVADPPSGRQMRAPVSHLHLRFRLRAPSLGVATPSASRVPCRPDFSADSGDST